jgi:outer membrane protein assembly factor BamB
MKHPPLLWCRTWLFALCAVGILCGCHAERPAAPAAAGTSPAVPAAAARSSAAPEQAAPAAPATPAAAPAKAEPGGVKDSANDWANWRGPRQDGTSPEKGLPDKFSIDPSDADSNLVWKAPYGGRSCPIIMDGHVYIINGAGGGVTDKERETQQERVLCLDADSGKLLWEHRFNVFLTDIVADRLGWSNPAGDPETGNVYAHGTQGFLFCFSKDGKIVWQHELTEEFGRISGYGGRLAGPAVDGDLVYISMLNSSWGDLAMGGNRFLALDKRTGKVVWWSSTGARPKDTYSSTPVFATINGERLLISGGGDGGVHAFQARTGKKVWSYFFGDGAVNISPIVHGTRVYIGHGESNPDTNRQGRVICLDAAEVKDGEPKLLWHREGIKAKFSSPILHDGRLYVCDLNARMYCLDAETGKDIWKFTYGRNGFGSPVLADGKIYIGAVNSTFNILKPGDKKCERLYEQYFPSRPGEAEVELNGSPAVANGRVYFLTSTDCYCIGKKDRSSASTSAPAEGKADAGDRDGKPAQLLVYPADVTLFPGESADFKVRLYDARGNFLHEAKDVEWSLGPMPPPVPPGGAAAPARPPATGAAPATPPNLQGEIDKEGHLTVAKERPLQFGVVIAKAEGLTGRVRVRVAPGLPFVADFSKVPVGRTPAGWVNTQGKFVMTDHKGKHVLVKTVTNPSPLVARANAFISVPTLSDYTIQSDMMGAKKGDDLPDMGLLANRYHLFLEGNTQRLRLVSWEKLPRIDKSIAYSWKSDTWYTLKLTVELHDGKARVRGKIWETGQSEPQDWTVELEDPVPNRHGSPGLYANAVGVEGEDSPGTPIYFDNVRVTPNKQ